MSLRQKSGTWAALATYVGTILGAGIFGVPYVMSRAGIGVGLLYVLIVGLLLMCVDLMYAEVVLAVREHRRFPGLAGVLLGKSGKWLATILGIVGNWAIVTIHIIIGGRFLYLLFSPVVGGAEFWYQLAMGVGGGLVVLGGLRLVARAELMLAGIEAGFVVFLGLVAAWSTSSWDLLSFSSSELFLPYGVTLFALSGTAIVPALEDLVGNGNRKRLQRVIIIGMLITMAVVGLFGAALAALGGGATSPDAISGLIPVFGPWIGVVGALAGFLLVITTFLALLMNQTEIFMFDYGLPRIGAWLAALGVPIAAFLFGARQFIPLLGAVGGVILGTALALTVLLYGALVIRQRMSRWLLAPVGFVILALLAGAYAELSILL